MASARFMRADHGELCPLQFQVAGSAAVPLVLQRGGVIGVMAVHATPRFTQVATNPASPLLPPGTCFLLAARNPARLRIICASPDAVCCAAQFVVNMFHARLEARLPGG